MLDIFKRRNKGGAPKWSQLTNEQKATVMKKIRNFMQSGPRYKVVSGFDQYQREGALTELQNEDFYLNAHRRGQLLDLVRNAVRNSPVFNGILLQMKENVVGVKGGKVLLNSPDVNLNMKLKELFAGFTRSCEFFDGASLNQALCLILNEYLIGGDCVLLFDDGLIEDSGKLLIYETDEIGDVSKEALEEHFGKDSTQSLGKVYNGNGRFIGCTVSRSQRGVPVFDAGKCYFLNRDPDASPFESKWLMPANTWRSAQGRGTSPAASSIGAIIDLEDLCNFELQAAKKNSQLFATIESTKDDSTDSSMPSAFDMETDFANMTDEEIEAAVKDESNAQQQTVSFNRAASCGIVYEQIPDHYKMTLLDTKHPNAAIAEFIDYMSGRAASVFGLNRNFVISNPDKDNFRAQQLMTQPMFIRLQKMLEATCDWLFWRYLKWLDKKGQFDMGELPENFMKYVSWDWPFLGELDEVQHQTAIEMKIKNCTSSLRETIGPDWREKLNEIREEIEYCRANGIPHPAGLLKSGGQAVEITAAVGEDEP